MTIHQKVEALCKQYETRNPFEIAEQLGIMILFEPLGSIRGYYSRTYRVPFIHINQELAIEQQQQVCAHELGHAILHPNSNTPFLRANTLYSINKLENEANRFMALLLYPPETLRCYARDGLTIPQISDMCGLTPELVEYSLNI